MKRALLIVVIVATAAFGVTISEAKVAGGKFAGATSAGDPVGFGVDRNGRVYSFYFEDVTLSCNDGDKFDSGAGGNRQQTPRPKRYKVKKGKFKIKNHDDAAGHGWDAKAKFKSKGNKATGTLKIYANFDEENNPEPNGPVRCESETLTFSVKRK